MPASDRQRNAIEMAFLWCANNGPQLNAGFGILRVPDILLGNPIFVIFKEGSDPLPPSRSAHALSVHVTHK